MDKVALILKQLFRSQKFYLTAGIVGVVGMAATSFSFANGVKDAIANAKHKNWKGFFTGMLKTVPFLICATSVILSLVVGHNVATGKISKATETIARLSNLASPVLATGSTKIEETIDKATDAIAEKVNTEEPKKDIPVNQNDDIEMIDSLSGQKFRSSIFKVKQAMNDFNAKLVSSQDFMSVNDWYYYLGLADVAMGEELGFQIDPNGNGLLRLDFQARMQNDKPITYIVYRVRPKTENTREY